MYILGLFGKSLIGELDPSCVYSTLQVYLTDFFKNDNNNKKPTFQRVKAEISGFKKSVCFKGSCSKGVTRTCRVELQERERL